MTERRNYGSIVAVVNNKGGVGKTTSAVNLAAGIAAGKRRVLLVDLDALFHSPRYEVCFPS